MSVLFKDFHQLSQSLLLWLASAESRREKAHVTDPEADPQVLLACQEELMVSFLLRDPALPLAYVPSGLTWQFWKQCPLVFCPRVPGWHPSAVPKRDECEDEEPWFRAESLNHSRTRAVGI